jgi:hypothetical protein
MIGYIPNEGEYCRLVYWKKGEDKPCDRLCVVLKRENDEALLVHQFNPTGIRRLLIKNILAVEKWTPMELDLT